MWHQVESRNDAVVRALASHECVPCLIPGPGVLCGLNLLLILFLAPRVFFSLGTPVFPSSQKPTFPNSNTIWIIVKHFNMILWLGWSHKYSLCLTFNVCFTFLHPATGGLNEQSKQPCNYMYQGFHQKPATGELRRLLSISAPPTFADFCHSQFRFRSVRSFSVKLWSHHFSSVKVRSTIGNFCGSL